MKNVLMLVLVSCLGAVASAESSVVLDCSPVPNSTRSNYSRIELSKYTDSWKGKTVANYDLKATAAGQEKFFLLNPPQYFNEDYDQYTVINNGIPVPAFAVLSHKHLDYAVLINQDGTKTHECQVRK